MNKDKLNVLAKKQEDEHLWNDAFKSYNLLYSQNPDITILEKLAWCASRASLYNQAIEYYLLLTKEQPDVAKWYYGLGYQYYMKQEWSPAIEWFNKVLELYPNYFVVKYRLGYALRQVCGNKLVLRRSEFWEALKNYSECDTLWENFTEELKRKNRSTYANVCFQKGKLLTERNKIDEAIICFEKSLFLKDNDYEECSYQLAKAYLSSENAEMAQKRLPSVSNKYYITELKIDIFLAMNELEEAKNLLIKHIQRRKKDYLYRKLAEIFLMENNLIEAIKYANLAYKLNQNNHLNRLVISKILFQAGFLKKAHFEAIQAIDLKMKNWSSTFDEAEILKEQIELKINENNYLNDDESELRKFFEDKEIQNKLSGEITQYYSDKGYGFIVAKGNKYFFHISSLHKYNYGKVKKGLKVTFEAINTPKGLSAKKVDLKDSI